MVKRAAARRAGDGDLTVTKRTKDVSVAEPGPSEAGVSVAGAGWPVREDELPWAAAELAEVRKRLQGEAHRAGTESAELAGTIADVLRDTGVGSGDDQADSGAKAFEREQEMSLLATAQETQFQIEHALQRIADGRYGICELCGGAIGKLRLQAFPRATLCVPCKQKQERR